MDRMYELPIKVLGPALAVTLLIALDAGHRLSRFGTSPGLSPGTSFGMVALLVAFSFSAAESRFTERRKLIVKEANAIHTAYLRSTLLGDRARNAMQDRLRRYVELRLRGLEDLNTEAAEALAASTRRLQEELWSLFESAAPAAPAPAVTVNVYSLNLLIEASAERKSAAAAQVPKRILFVILLATIVGAFSFGYQPAQEHRPWPLWAMFSSLIAALLTTLIDLDRPRSGLIRTTRRPLLDLRAAFSGPIPDR